jgi:hypothetical protein
MPSTRQSSDGRDVRGARDVFDAVDGAPRAFQDKIHNLLHVAAAGEFRSGNITELKISKRNPRPLLNQTKNIKPAKKHLIPSPSKAHNTDDDGCDDECGVDDAACWSASTTRGGHGLPHASECLQQRK